MTYEEAFEAWELANAEALAIAPAMPHQSRYSKPDGWAFAEEHSALCAASTAAWQALQEHQA